MTPRIDTHQHFWRYDPQRYSWIDDDMPQLRRDFLPDDLEPLLTANGVDGCIAVQACSEPSETDALLAMAEQHPWIRAVIGWVDLRAPELGDTLDQWAGNSRLRGFRHLVQDEPSPSGCLAEHGFCRGVAELQRRGYVYELLVRQDDLPASLAFCRKHDGHVLILDHLGKPSVKDERPQDWVRRVRPLAELEHVSCKLSGLFTEADWQHWQPDQLLPYYALAIELFGPSRLMFGSDWPVCLLAARYSQACELLETALHSLTAHEREAIRGGNACRLYSLQGLAS
jgi:L-fuconolactonase